MPVYQNESQYRRVVGSDVIEPGKSIQRLVYYNLKGVDGVRVIDDFPYYSPIIVSEKISENREVVIPKFTPLFEFLDKFSLHFYAELGEVTVNFNVPTNKVPLRLYPGAKWNIRCTQRLIDKLYISSEKPFSLWVIIEKIQ